VSVVVDGRGQLVSPPQFHGRGVQLPRDQGEWLSQARVVVKRALRQAVQDGELSDLEGLREGLRRRLTRLFFDSLAIKVVCLVNVHVVR
jgi:hypothetical protein